MAKSRIPQDAFERKEGHIGLAKQGVEGSEQCFFPRSWFVYSLRIQCQLAYVRSGPRSSGYTPVLPNVRASSETLLTCSIPQEDARDLSFIKSKVDKGEYTTARQVDDDVELMLENARVFNEEGPVVEAANAFGQWWQAQREKMD